MAPALLLPIGLAVAVGALAAGLSQLLLAYLRRRTAGDVERLLSPAAAAVLAAATAAAATALLLSQPFTVTAAVRALWVAVLAVVFTVDLRTHYILDALTLPAAVLALLAAVMLGPPTLPSALVGGSLGLGLFLLFYLLGLLLFRGREPLGLGDVKLAALLGLMLGFPVIANALFVGVVLGGMVSLALILSGRVRLGDAPAYGTYLAIGGYVALLTQGR